MRYDDANHHSLTVAARFQTEPSVQGRVMLIAIGSAGDVHPFVGLGREFKRRGHDVLIVTNGYFQSLVESAGLNYLELGTRDEYLTITNDPDLWHPKRGFHKIMHWTRQSLRPLYELVNREAPACSLILGSTLALGARLAQDQHHWPYVSVHLAPICFRSYVNPPNYGFPFSIAKFPRWFNRALLYLADRGVIDPAIAPALNDIRRQIGLPPLRHVFHHWLHSPRLTLGLFPAWFAQPESDWPPQTHLTDFPRYDERGLAPLPPALPAFLQQHPRPIVFTPGSAHRHATAFFRTALDTCQRLNTPGILLTRFTDQLPSPLPAHVLHLDYAPLSELLPHAAAFVHHGGIGSLSQGFAAGVPQLIMTMSHDQFDNARRATHLGVAQSVLPRQFTAARIAPLLRELMASPNTRHAADDLRAKLQPVNGLAMTVDLLLRV